MRLDHLLSKENWSDEILWSSVLRSVQSAEQFTLFNLEGTLSGNTRVENGGLAQLGERLPCKQEVSGSIPLISTKKKLTEVPTKVEASLSFLREIQTCTLKTEHCEL